MGNNIKDIQQIKSLIAKGKEMGFLTFEEVNKAVPLEMNTPEQFEEIIGIFDQLENRHCGSGKGRQENPRHLG